MTNATRKVQTDADWDAERTPVAGFDLAQIDAESLSFDADPTQVISEVALAELCSESAQRDTPLPGGLCWEETLAEKVAAAQVVVAQNIAAARKR